MELGRMCLLHVHAISAIVLLLHISCGACANVTRCVEREREALLAIKQDLVINSTRLSSWGAEAINQDCCAWEGVYCDHLTGHVDQLHLGGEVLSSQGELLDYIPFKGTLSPKLIELQQLVYIDLSSNMLQPSPIPGFIGSLSHMRYLDLSEAGFVGEIPYHELGNLTHLQYLDLSSSDFTNSIEFFSWLPHLSSLKYLDLSFVNLSNVFDWPETVNKLHNLRNLTLYGCQLPPPIISSTTLSDKNTSQTLAFVDLSKNSLTSSLFKWLCNINATLALLNLSHNKLSGSLPDCIGNMSSLTHLNLSGNQLEGRIPDSFAKLCSLQELVISSCNLSGHISNFFESSCAQNSLEILDLTSNNFTGSFPDMTRFQALRELYLRRNKLNGTIPESIGNMSKLETIGVSHNDLEGVITEAHFSKLSKLGFLYLSSNFLVLDFHSEWIPPFQLESLVLNSCKMGPLFPKWLQTQKNLRQLSLSDVGISDTIPSWFWDLSHNKLELDLSCNEIKGTLADLRFEFAYQPEVNLSWNQLQGPIPSFLSKASAVDLSNNKFSKLYSFLCSTNVSNLNYLDLSSNYISGELPDCWKHFENLVFLDLSNNTFSGKIPSTMGSLSSIETLKLDDNMFMGELPSSLKNCTKLRAFDLENNELSGPILEWLGVGASNLAILILRSNHFNGSMPSQLCHLTSIQVLDLSMNNISGNIPKCLNNWTSLAQKGNPALTIRHSYISQNGSGSILGLWYDDEISIIWKGRLSNYKSTLGLLKSIDFSSNRLTGEIPVEITHLLGLISLNLAGNYLTGTISPEIGKLQSLQSLDLSRNQISSSIPPSLLKIYGLGYLNLSYNNLFGKIPIGTQLQNYGASSFLGNPKLCGIPLEICNLEGTGQPNVSSDQEDSDNKQITRGFYISLGLGFVVGFWGLCGSLIFKRSWRYKYYNFLNASHDWLYVKYKIGTRISDNSHNTNSGKGHCQMGDSQEQSWRGDENLCSTENCV
ncbi:PREDICTED: probable leucine-rich repeat receptor-like protein kinase At1g35710 [Fragaria vesca subsp. vesca]|uniref:probable leucine-rich repeat receptor-like protein kinase At1g35710 n=1 Tax=Fragaria vesca subsp. vesca TaxID=101020 RepID=UPI0002C3746D|nr:PREDICTED: probable leucine-rich repeat receptor-like protein kinase At1g35710 [Fragaria vesca subsp. vesca]